MAGEDFEFTDLDLATVGAVGAPGRRVFLLQARAGAHVATLKLEKQQVAALSEALVERLADLPVVGPLPQDLDLEPPLEVAWVVGSLGLGYLDALDRIVLDAIELVPIDEEGEPAELAAHARLLMTRAQATALAIRASDLVEAGRPACSLCGHPLDPAGHTCPRTNGKHAPER